MGIADKFNGFVFDGPRIEDIDLPRIGHDIGVGEDVIHGVMDVETGGSGTDKRGRLKALYEPHVAYRNSKGAVRDKLVKAGLAYPKWKRDYPADSYPRILKAMAIDETVALLATSWGLPQILGENYALAGYESVQDMVKDFIKDEDNQLEAMVRFIVNAGLDDDLRDIEAKLRKGEKIAPSDCVPFVLGYNGKGYKANDYHTKLAASINRWAKIPDTVWSPATEQAIKAVEKKDLYDGNVHAEVKAAQERLDALGYPEVGAVDGRWGTKTRAAILAFRADNQLPLEPVIDETLLAAMMIAKPRPVAPERRNATVADLRDEGAEDIKQADATQVAGGAAAAVGGFGAVKTILDQLDGYSSTLSGIVETIQPIYGFVQDNFWLLLIGVGGFVVWKSGVLKNIRLLKHQTGNDVSV